MILNFLKSNKLLSVVLTFAFGFVMCFPETVVSAEVKSVNANKTHASAKLRKSQNKNGTNTVREVPNTTAGYLLKPNNTAWTSKEQGPQYREDELIVKFKQNVNPKAAKNDVEFGFYQCKIN